MAGPRLELRWEVTAQQLVECLCFWRHGTALGRVGMTDRLKKLTPRRPGAAEPPASKRQLTLVWWDMEDKIESAHWPLEEDEGWEPEIVRITVADILPVYNWEADLLRDRPQLKSLCSLMLEIERWEYKRECNVLTEEELKWEEGHEMFLTPFGVRWRESRSSSAVSTTGVCGPGPDPGPDYMVTALDSPRSSLSSQVASPAAFLPRHIDDSLVTESEMSGAMDSQIDDHTVSNGRNTAAA